MFAFTDETMWLTVTNIALGAVVVAACIVVARVFAVELFDHLRTSFVSQHSSAHELFVSDLGLTMADGGEPIEAKKNTTSADAPASDTNKQ